MTNTVNTISMPGALELLVIAVIVGTIVLVVGPKKARTALGAVIAIVLGLGLLWFMAMPFAGHVSRAYTRTTHSTIAPMSVTIDGTSSSSDNLIMPALPSGTTPVLPNLEMPALPNPEAFHFEPGPLAATGGGKRMVVGIGPLIILLAIIAGLVALFLRSRRPGRIVLGVLAGVPLLLILVLFSIRVGSQREAARLSQGLIGEVSAARRAAAIREDDRVKAGPTIREQAKRGVERARNQIAGHDSASSSSTAVMEWTPSDQHVFEADLYPSKQSAAVALAKHSLNQYLAELMPNETLQAVSVSVSEDLNGAILDRMTAQITQQVSLARTTGFQAVPPQTALRVTVDSVRASAAAPADSPSATPGSLILRFVTTRDLSAEQSDDGAVGEIQLTLRTQAGERLRTARFVNAPWAEGFARWTRQGPGTWVLGESDQLWPTEDQARTDAFQRAAEGIERQLRDYIARNGRYAPASTIVERPGWLMGQIIGELQSGHLVKTEFNQGFERPYGKVYRRAVLVNLPPERIQQLADRYFRHVDQVRDTWGRSLGSALALVALVFLVYLVLNAATRGYYVWVMRTAAVMAAVVGVFLVYLFAASAN